jgi:hypothetical protein
MTLVANFQGDRQPLPLRAQVVIAERQVVERHKLVRVRTSLLQQRIRDRLMTVLLLSGAGLGFITGEFTAKKRAPMNQRSSNEAPLSSTLVGAAGTVFSLVRAALALRSLVTALGAKERIEP